MDRLKKDAPGGARTSGRATARNTSAQRERTREAILAAAFALIGHAEGRAVRIEEICSRAAISRGSFYNYFAGMEALFAALAIDLTHAFTLAVLDEMGRMDGAAEQTDAALRYYLERAVDDPAWAWAMVNIGATGPLFGAETHASALATVEAGIAAGEFKLPSARLGRAVILGACHAAIVDLLRDGVGEVLPSDVSRAVLRALGIAESDIDRIVARRLPPPRRQAGGVSTPG